jgi:hypothetical protein
MTLHWRGIQRRRTGEGHGPLQIIGTGLSRTGTLSTRIALDQMGVGHYDHIMGDPCAEQITVRTKAASDRFTNWNIGYADFGSRIDFPGGSVWKQTVTTFSGARVVHTERPEEEWWESFRDTFLKVLNAHETLHRHMPQQIQDTFAAVTPFYIDDSFDGLPNKDRAIAAYRRTNREVREAVSPDRLLVFSPSDGWGPLCAFVQIPEPSTPFPHRNCRAEFWSHFSQDQADA